MNPRVLIVCEHASTEFGGEAMLPLNYFILLSQRLPMVCLLTHERSRRSISNLPGVDQSRVFYMPDTLLHIWLHKLGHFLPDRIALVTTRAAMHLITQVYQWAMAKKIIHNHGITVVHEPAPVSPKQPSMMFGLGVPVIVGPMNGGMQFPSGFNYMAGRGERFIYTGMRWFAEIYNLIVPGKLFASYLLVANKRTEAALPRLRLGNVCELVENAVFSSMIADHLPCRKVRKEINVLYVGRLVELKCVDVLIDAIAACSSSSIRLTIVGDGPERKSLETQVSLMRMDNVHFAGAVQFGSIKDHYDGADIFVLPSVRECGGAVVLEAMSRGLPVVAVNWGGPADYLTHDTGILIYPESRNHMVTEIAKAIDRLASSVELREQYGRAAIKRVCEQFTWEEKASKIIEIYKSAMR